MPRTLIVDDDPDTEKTLRERLKHELAGDADEFAFASTEAEALELLRGEAGFDMAMVSIDSQQISGMDMFRQLKDTPVRIPRIALTGGGDMDAIRKAMNQGAADFLTKPLKADDLIATLRRVWAQCERRRRAWRTEAELAAIQREVDLAAELQRGLLPQGLPRHPELDVHAGMLPARQMGGDFYDLFEVDPQRLALVVADVAGKGIPAAFYMAVVRTLMRTTVERGAEPAVCLAAVNDALCQQDAPGMFVSVFLAVLEPASGRLTFSNAGHPPPCLLPASGDTLRFLGGAQGTVLGVEPGLEYAQADLRLAPADALFCYTDGLSEAFDAEREQFGSRRIAAALGAMEPRSSAAELAAGVLSQLARFTHPGHPADDVTTLVLRRL